VYDKIETITCEECDYKQILCFTWKIEKQWCISRASTTTGNQFIQFNTGYYWFISVNDINESLHIVKYMNNANEKSHYNIGSQFAPSQKDRFLRGPAKTVLESNETFRWIDLNTNNIQAIQRLDDAINDLKRQLEEANDEKRDK
ncbi:19061_t:CDS:1, partial [Dentiscutata erythropus]